jgi:hypothetical protein
MELFGWGIGGSIGQARRGMGVVGGMLLTARHDSRFWMSDDAP